VPSVFPRVTRMVNGPRRVSQQLVIPGFVTFDREIAFLTLDMRTSV
jgi:hypothetical protein